MNHFVRLWLGLALALTVVNGAQTSFQLSGTTLKLGGIPYFVPPSPVSQLQFGAVSKQIQSLGTAFPAGLIPFSAITTDAAFLDQKGVQRTLNTWESLDDVWNRSFLTGTLRFIKVFDFQILMHHLFRAVHLVQWNFPKSRSLSVQLGKELGYPGRPHFYAICFRYQGFGKARSRPLLCRCQYRKCTPR